MSSMRSAMMSTVEYDGKTYALSSFGIMTSTDYTEGGLLHIYGDADDSVYSAKDDKLKKHLMKIRCCNCNIDRCLWQTS